MTQIAIRCRPGRSLTLPNGDVVPPHDAPEGLLVARDMFVRRRLADEDIEIVPAGPPPAAPASTPATRRAAREG